MAVDQATRAEFQARRDAGLRARHAWRLNHAQGRAVKLPIKEASLSTGIPVETIKTWLKQRRIVRYGDDRRTVVDTDELRQMRARPRARDEDGRFSQLRRV